MIKEERLREIQKMHYTLDADRHFSFTVRISGNSDTEDSGGLGFGQRAKIR